MTKSTCFYLLLLSILSCNPLGTDGVTDDNFCAHPSGSCEAQTGDDDATDTVNPKLTSIVTPIGATKISGESITFDLVFSEPIKISGTFSIELLIGSETKQAECISSVEKKLQCSYTFEEDNSRPDFDLDGITFVGFNISNGLVKDLAGNNADLTISLPDISNIKVNFSNFDHWLDANDQATLFSDSACSVSAVDGDNISCWVDKKSGNSAKSTGINKPLYSKVGGPNSKGTLYFNIDHVDYTSAVTIGVNHTVFVVYDVVHFNTLNYFIGSIGGGASSGIGFGFGGNWTGGPAGDGLFGITKSTSGLVSTLSSRTELMDWATATYTPSKIFRNITEATPYSSTQPLSLPQDFKRIGRREDGNGCCDHNGNIAELMIFSQTLSSIERKKVWCYLSDKYSFGYTDC